MVGRGTRGHIVHDVVATVFSHLYTDFHFTTKTGRFLQRQCKRTQTDYNIEAFKQNIQTK
jgi:hypothetical protein